MAAPRGRRHGPGQLAGSTSGCSPSTPEAPGVVAAAAARGVRVVGLGPFARDRGDLPPSLVIGFGDIDDEGVRDALPRLRDAIDQ
ncbi:hypothetical protein ACLBXX_19460, partial [Microbacterium sp. C23T]